MSEDRKRRIFSKVYRFGFTLGQNALRNKSGKFVARVGFKVKQRHKNGERRYLFSAPLISEDDKNSGVTDGLRLCGNMGSASSSATNPFESSVTETFAGTLESKVVSFAPKRRFSSVSESPLTLFFSPSARVVTASFRFGCFRCTFGDFSVLIPSKSLLTRIGSQNGFLSERRRS